NLIRPVKPFFRVLSELDVVRRIRVDEIIIANRHGGEISAEKFPRCESRTIRGEIGRVCDSFVFAEGNIEFAAAVEPTEPVISRAVQIVEECCRFTSAVAALAKQSVEARAIRVEQRGIVFKAHIDTEAALEPSVEVDQVR